MYDMENLYLIEFAFTDMENNKSVFENAKIQKYV